jgi:hypothetical protein
MDPTAKGRLFQQMHLGPEILVIANAWDAASARVFEDAGMRAVASTSTSANTGNCPGRARARSSRLLVSPPAELRPAMSGRRGSPTARLLPQRWPAINLPTEAAAPPYGRIPQPIYHPTGRGTVEFPILSADWPGLDP